MNNLQTKHFTRIHQPFADHTSYNHSKTTNKLHQNHEPKTDKCWIPKTMKQLKKNEHYTPKPNQEPRQIKNKFQLTGRERDFKGNRLIHKQQTNRQQHHTWNKKLINETIFHTKVLRKLKNAT